MTGLSELPPVCDDGHVVVLTSTWPPMMVGSSVLMSNLLRCFSADSYTVVTASDKKSEVPDGSAVHLMRSFIWPKRLSSRFCDLQYPVALARLVQLLRQRNVKAIVGVYPDYHFLSLARRAAKITRTPWCAYLHDTVAEGLSDGALARRAELLQGKVFDEASSVLVMSRGMADLYRSKYDFESSALEHTYNEPIPDEPPDEAGLRQLFWAGNVYEINRSSVLRVFEALRQIQTPLFLATSKDREGLARDGLRGDHLRTGFYRQRDAYLDVIRQQGALLLALDWPEESRFHEDELATIFPTKTPEYLATGRPIVVHCPEHYFLARFFRERGCGVVVTERSVDALSAAITSVLDDRDRARELGRAALDAAKLFRAERISQRFKQAVEAVAKTHWSEPTPAIS